MTPQNPSEDQHTPHRRFRAPQPTWDAYKTVCARVFGRDRSEDLLEHVRAVIREHGTPEEIAKLEEGERELSERRSRKGGRPRKE